MYKTALVILLLILSRQAFAANHHSHSRSHSCSNILSRLGGVGRPRYSREFLHEICRAAAAGDLKGVVNAHKKGEDINARESSSETPLMLAAAADSLSVVEYLVKNGADLNAGADERTVLHYATQTAGDRKVLKYLLDAGAEINNATLRGYTPLYLAASLNQTEELRFLIERGATFRVAKLRDLDPIERFPVIMGSALLDVWEKQFRSGKFSPQLIEDLIYLRDKLLKVFITTADSSSVLNATNPNDQIYHVLLRLRDFPIEPKVLTPEVVSKAQQLMTVENKKLGIQISDYGSMLVQKVGYLENPTAAQVAGMKPIIFKKLANSQDTIVSGFVPANISIGENELSGGLGRVWLRTDPERARTLVKFNVDGKTYERPIQRLALSWGGSRAYYLDEPTGLIFSICIDCYATQKERIESAVEIIDKILLNEMEKKSGIIDAYQIIKESIGEVSVEIRSAVVQKLLDLRYGQMMSTKDQQKLLSNKTTKFWSDIRFQIESFIKMVENYRKHVPDEANIDFPLDKKSKVLGFRVSSDRGMQLARDWLKKAGVQIDADTPDLEAYIRGLELVSMLDSWITLPIDRAILLAFRDGVFSHPNMNKSHLKVLKIAAETAGRIATLGDEVTEEEALIQYNEALRKLNLKIHEERTSSSKSISPRASE
ncbi:MAG: uncharacterized protein JWQ35_987 [Bacteriovoracaceae bacterium]|nr:uncharacterized protein [Bacteriovoracaceae bacterium]